MMAGPGDEMAAATPVRSRLRASHADRLLDPWRATKLAWRTVYAIILPAIVTLIVLPGGRGNPAMGVVITTAVVTYLLFWLCGVSVMVYSRQEKRSRGELPPQSAPDTGR
jgi:lipopolysaccharide export LptBFGC system permease protein LptF